MAALKSLTIDVRATAGRAQETLAALAASLERIAGSAEEARAALRALPNEAPPAQPASPEAQPEASPGAGAGAPMVAATQEPPRQEPPRQEPPRQEPPRQDAASPDGAGLSGREAELAALRALLDAKLLTEAEYRRAVEEMEEAHAAKLAGMKDRQAEDDTSRLEDRKQASIRALSEIAAAAAKGAGGGKEFKDSLRNLLGIGLQYADRLADTALAAALAKTLLGDVTALASTAAVKAALKALRTKIASFRAGGYTGEGPESATAGVVEYREFVVNADATRRNRAVLELMNRGLSLDQITGGPPALPEPAPRAIPVPVHLTGEFVYRDGALRMAIDELIGADFARKI